MAEAVKNSNDSNDGIRKCEWIKKRNVRALAEKKGK
jgi:hypothetical protein